MTISNQYELWAIYRLILEYKFNTLKTLPEIIGSKYVSAVANRIALEFECTEVFDKLFGHDALQTWRKLTPLHFGWSTVVRYIQLSSKWDEWTENERKIYVEYLISPLIISDEDTTLLLTVR